jgi:uncharacterized protein YndB with AHSA1/START domain
MDGDHQLSREVAIDAPREHVWALVADSSRLAEWAPPVKEVSELSDGPEGVGTTRVCQVEFGGRTGTMTERCVEFQPPHRAAYVVDADSLGFGRMFANYGFTITIEDGPNGGSIARTETYYTPRNPLLKLINALIMRRRFKSTVDDLLSGLKRTSERDVAPARSSSPRPRSHPVSS